MADLSQSVLVEYTFPDLPSAAARDLPRRVEAAIHSLVARERLPSDEDVRAIVCGVAGRGLQNEDLEDAGEKEEQNPRVQVMLPHEIALDLAVHRSFHTVQPSPAEPLTQVELRTLTRRSRQMRLRATRCRITVAGSARCLHETCVVCLNPVQCTATRIVLECAHEFHRCCITGWLNTQRACPTCRQEVDLDPRAGELHLLSVRRTRSGGGVEREENTEFELEDGAVINL